MQGAKSGKTQDVAGQKRLASTEVPRGTEEDVDIKRSQDTRDICGKILSRLNFNFSV